MEVDPTDKPVDVDMAAPLTEGDARVPSAPTLPRWGWLRLPPFRQRSLGFALSLSGLSRLVSLAVPALWGRGSLFSVSLPCLCLGFAPGASPVPAGFGGSCGCPRLVPLSVSRRVFAAFGSALGSAASRVLRPPGLGGASLFPPRVGLGRPSAGSGSLCLALPCGFFLGGLSGRVLVPPGFWPSFPRRLVA